MNLCYLIIFLFGLVIGSFLNCVIFRLEKGESFLKGRSYCPNCRHQLSWQDLVPVFSLLFLRKKCRYCQKPISWQYPLVEIITGIIFVLIFWKLGLMNYLGFGIRNLEFIYYLIISSLLIVIFVYDLKYYIIPDGVVFSAIGIVFLYNLGFMIWNLFGHWSLGFGILNPLINPLLSAIFASLFFLVIFLVSRGKWMGFGDVKLAFFMGLFLGFPKILTALFLAFFIGAIIGVCLIIFGKKKFSSEVPFGPFLVMGTFLALLFGEKLINWYLGFITI